jgi:predicted RNase H-like HicB family nuclease
MQKGNLAFTGVIVKQGKAYTSLCLELDVASQGDTRQDAKDALIEAVTLYLESAIESNLPYIRPVPPEDDPRRVVPKQVIEAFPITVAITIRTHA